MNKFAAELGHIAGAANSERSSAATQEQPQPDNKQSKRRKLVAIAALLAAAGGAYGLSKFMRRPDAVKGSEPATPSLSLGTGPSKLSDIDRQVASERDALKSMMTAGSKPKGTTPPPLVREPVDGGSGYKYYEGVPGDVSIPWIVRKLDDMHALPRFTVPPGVPPQGATLGYSGKIADQLSDSTLLWMMGVEPKTVNENFTNYFKQLPEKLQAKTDEITYNTLAPMTGESTSPIKVGPKLLSAYRDWDSRLADAAIGDAIFAGKPDEALAKFKDQEGMQGGWFAPPREYADDQ